MQTPTDDDHPLTWARFYRTQGFIPLPILSSAEIEVHAANQRFDHPEWSEDEIERAKSCRKHPFVKWAGRVWIDSPPDDAQLEAWFAEHPERGIYLLTGTGAGVTVIDVDPDKGGDGSSWEPLATTVTTSPSGGYHLWFDESAAKTTAGKVAPGIDIRGVGGGFVAPSGTGSPGRQFVRLGLPLSEYPIRAPAPRLAVVSAPAGSLMMKVEARPGSFADTVSSRRVDGTRTTGAKVIVGMLCRPVALPLDALAAALGLLDEVDAVTRDAVRPGWHDALSSAHPRSQEFVVQFITTWNDLRCDPPWPPAKCAQIAESLWRSASREQSASTSPPSSPRPGTPAEPITDPSSSETVTETVMEEIDRLFMSSARVTPASRLAANRYRKLLSCATLPANLNEDGFLDERTPYGTGLGPWLNEAIGRGIGPGYFGILVAKRAKAGKTAFLDQFLTGLTMQGAHNYGEAKAGRPHGPIIMQWVVTEMNPEELDERSLARYMGCDQDIFRAGGSAVDAPGVRAMAERLRISREAVVEQLYSQAASVLSGSSLFATAQRLRRYVDTSIFPEANLAAGLKSGQCGPMMLRILEPYIRKAQAELAKDAGVPLSDVWPVLLIDPIQRFIDPTAGDIAGVDGFTKELRRLANTGMIVMCSSDTNKASNSDGKPGKDDEKLSASAMVARALRGSNSLCHLPDAAMLLETTSEREPNGSLKWHATIHLGFSRRSAATEEAFPFDYCPASGRFTAVDPQSRQQPKASAKSGPAQLIFAPQPPPKRDTAAARAARKNAST